MSEHQQHCAVAATLIDQMAGMLRGVDLSTPVPTCPGWDLQRLVVHLGGIHRWAAQLVEARAPERAAPVKSDRGDDLVEWLAAGALPVAAMAAAPGDDAMWSWGADQHVRFWSRRMVHETAVHFADAAMAVGEPLHLDAALAIDGIDELLENLPYATFSESVRNLRGADSIHLHGTDTDHAEWMIQLHDAGFSWEHAHGKGSVAVRGTAIDLYLLLWGRRSLQSGAFETFGDESVMRFWLEHARV